MPLNARVSIHTPVWGVTVLHGFDADNYIGFNPHARVGRDKMHYRTTFESRCFNPHARVGRDLTPHWLPVPYWWFQSTRPCGA